MKVAAIDSVLGERANEVAGTLDHRIAKFEDLLVREEEPV